MKKIAAMSLFLFAFTTLVFAHAGEVHSYMGTITMLHADSFMIKKADGKTMTVRVSKTTQYLRADKHAAKRSELKTGSRVVVKMSKDGKTALSVTMGAGRKK